jgi:hypothetical protein
MRMSLVTVIMPVYNGEAYVREAMVCGLVPICLRRPSVVLD